MLKGVIRDDLSRICILLNGNYIPLIFSLICVPLSSCWSMNKSRNLCIATVYQCPGKIHQE